MRSDRIIEHKDYVCLPIFLDKCLYLDMAKLKVLVFKYDGYVLRNSNPTNDWQFRSPYIVLVCFGKDSIQGPFYPVYIADNITIPPNNLHERNLDQDVLSEHFPRKT